MDKAILLLGTNLGDLDTNLSRALSMIHKKSGKIVASSSIYKTAPWGFNHNNHFLNQVIRIETSRTPGELLEDILEIEKELGRIRETSEPGFKARTIDIDILFYNDLIINDKNLIIPHPQLHKRKFTLVPLVELNENYIHPILKKTTKELLLNCMDNLEVTLYKEVQVLNLN